MKIFVGKNRSVLATQFQKWPLVFVFIRVSFIALSFYSLFSFFKENIVRWTSSLDFDFSYEVIPFPRKFDVIITNSDQIDHYSKQVMQSVSKENFFKDVNSPEAIAKILLNYGIFEHIQVTISDIDRYLIALKLRAPAFCIFLDKTKYIDNHGYIFGNPQTKEDCKIGTILGLRDELKPQPNKKFEQGDGAEHIKLIVKEARILKSLLSSSNIDIANDIIYHKTRGFMFHITHPRILVIIGREPYFVNIKRLARILTQDDILSIDRIELDYMNKVFVRRGKTSLNLEESGPILR